jgi:hypothetical protein
MTHGIEMNRIIAEHWNKETHELPGFDCIVYPGGDVTILNCYSLQDSETKARELFCRPRCDTTIDSIEKYGAAYWTSVDEWTSIEYCGGSILGGDGSMGNMGFVAHVDGGGGLIWGIFFWNTNPIKSLTINSGILSAVNEHSHVRIDINLENLADITMTILHAPWDGVA